jgi:hypothetical protein
MTVMYVSVLYSGMQKKRRKMAQRILASNQIVELKWSFLKVEIIADNIVIQGTNGITGVGSNHKMIQIQFE